MANVLPACLLLALLLLAPALPAQHERGLIFNLVRGDRPHPWHRMLQLLRGTCSAWRVGGVCWVFWCCEGIWSLGNQLYKGIGKTERGSD